MRRARVIWAIVLIAAAATVAAWLLPDRSEPQRAESLHVDGSPTEQAPALAALPESRDAAAAKARDEGSSADTEVASKEVLTTLRVEVRVGDEIRRGVTVRARKPEETRPFKTATTDVSGFVEFEDVEAHDSLPPRTDVNQPHDSRVGLTSDDRKLTKVFVLS